MSASTADVFASLRAAQTATADLGAEAEFLTALPIRLSIWGSFVAYGMTTGKAWPRWVGGFGLAWLGVEYFAARRRAQLAAAAATTSATFTIPQGGVTG